MVSKSFVSDSSSKPQDLQVHGELRWEVAHRGPVLGVTDTQRQSKALPQLPAPPQSKSLWEQQTFAATEVWVPPEYKRNSQEKALGRSWDSLYSLKKQTNKKTTPLFSSSSIRINMLLPTSSKQSDTNFTPAFISFLTNWNSDWVLCWN